MKTSACRDETLKNQPNKTPYAMIYVAVLGSVILLHISTTLLHLKRCSAVLLLRAGLILTEKLHQCLISLHSAYKPHP